MADSVSLQSTETNPAVPLTWLCHPTLCSRSSAQRREAKRLVGSAALPACRAAPCAVAGAQRRKGRGLKVGGEGEGGVASHWLNLNLSKTVFLIRTAVTSTATSISKCLRT